LNAELISQRLRNHQLNRSEFRTAQEVVSWMVAVQSQDYPSAKWGLGLRGKGLTDEGVEQEFAAGAILRTHVMRPTWHFVTPADIRWMLALTGARVHKTCSAYYRKLELDDRTFTRSQKAMERALRGGNELTRAELKEVLSRAGIVSSGQRLAFLMMHAELDAVICSGARRGAQFTYALLDERAPQAKTLTRDEALAELTRRYFLSHGPATIRDYVWWSGLTVPDARSGIAMVGRALEQTTIGDRTCYRATSRARTVPAPPSAHFLPNYDEYGIAYQDRDLVGSTRRMAEPGAPSHDDFAHLLLINGQLAGRWRRAVKNDSVLVRLFPYNRPTRIEQRTLATAAERYSTFMNLRVKMSIG
jgi:hypothetical protein